MQQPPDRDRTIASIETVLMVVFGVLTLVAAIAYVVFSIRQRPWGPLALIAGVVGISFGLTFARLWGRFKARRSGYVDERGNYIPPQK